MSVEIFNQDFAEEVRLRCVGCGYAYLHHGTVEIFNRDAEDSRLGLHLTINYKRVDYDTNVENGNPSTRRDGICIKLRCENCEEVTLFTLAQHKGETFISVHK